MRALPFFHSLLLAVFATAGHAQSAHWYKGNTHTHTLWSDGNDFPEMVTDWYVKQGYHFLALSDHNVLQAKEVWMSVAKVEARRKALGKTTMEKYRARFDGDWVQTREMDGKPEVRLRKLKSIVGCSRSQASSCSCLPKKSARSAAKLRCT